MEEFLLCLLKGLIFCGKFSVGILVSAIQRVQRIRYWWLLTKLFFGDLELLSKSTQFLACLLWKIRDAEEAFFFELCFPRAS